MVSIVRGLNWSSLPTASERLWKTTLNWLQAAICALDLAPTHLLTVYAVTSNNPDALDEALTRPGRVDKKVQFGNLSKDSARGIFERLIGRAAIAANR